MSKDKGKILLIEDNPLAGELVDFILEREGFNVEWLYEGRSASQYIAEQPPADLIVTELVLPYISGFDLLTQLRDTPSWADRPVLFLTDSDDERDIVRALQAGAGDYVSKPFRPVELSARIKRLLKAF